MAPVPAWAGKSVRACRRLVVRSAHGHKEIFISLLRRLRCPAIATSNPPASAPFAQSPRMAMKTASKAAHTLAKDYVVKDIALAEWGAKEIAIAETEMPGL